MPRMSSAERVALAPLIEPPVPIRRHGLIANFCRACEEIINVPGIASLIPRAFIVRFTITQRHAIYPRDLVKRVFTPAMVNMVSTRDSAYFPCGYDLAQKCSILDKFSNRVVGWAVASHIHADPMIAALKMAYVTWAQANKWNHFLNRPWHAIQSLIRT